MTDDLTSQLQQAVSSAELPAGTSQRALSRARRVRRRRGLSGLAAVALVAAGGVLLVPGHHHKRASLSYTSANPSPLLVENGTHVKANAYVVAVGSSVRLCGGARYDIDPGFSSQKPDPVQCDSSTAIELHHLDSSSVPAVEGGRAGNLVVKGIWQDGSIDVTSTSAWTFNGGPSALLTPAPVFDDNDVPCPTPAAGWRKRIPQEDYPAALLADRAAHPDDAVVTAILYPPGGQVLAVLAADETAAARFRTLLTPQYGGGLCIVVSRYSLADIAKAQAGAPGVTTDKTQPGIQAGLQTYVTWDTTVVDDRVQAALDALPEGIVYVRSAVVTPDASSRTPQPAPGR